MRNRNTPVALEGVPFIAAGVVVTLLLALFYFKVAALFFLAVTLFVTYFFRNPKRVDPSDTRAVVAPADGTVIFIGKAYEEHLGTEGQKISIFMSVFNVHINRAPFWGKVIDSFYTSGKFLDVRDERATFENERSGLVIETPKGLKMVVVQVAGLIARRIVCYPDVGQELVRGSRYGLIRFGSRLDIYLPPEAEVAARMGDKTVAGETVIGYLP